MEGLEESLGEELADLSSKVSNILGTHKVLVDVVIGLCKEVVFIKGSMHKTKRDVHGIGESLRDELQGLSKQAAEKNGGSDLWELSLKQEAELGAAAANAEPLTRGLSGLGLLAQRQLELGFASDISELSRRLGGLEAAFSEKKVHVEEENRLDRAAWSTQVCSNGTGSPEGRVAGSERFEEMERRLLEHVEDLTLRLDGLELEVAQLAAAAPFPGKLRPDGAESGGEAVTGASKKADRQPSVPDDSVMSDLLAELAGLQKGPREAEAPQGYPQTVRAAEAFVTSPCPRPREETLQVPAGAEPVTESLRTSSYDWSPPVPDMSPVATKSRRESSAAVGEQLTRASAAAAGAAAVSLAADRRWLWPKPAPTDQTPPQLPRSLSATSPQLPMTLPCLGSPVSCTAQLIISEDKVSTKPPPFPKRHLRAVAPISLREPGGRQPQDRWS